MKISEKYAEENNSNIFHNLLTTMTDDNENLNADLTSNKLLSIKANQNITTKSMVMARSKSGRRKIFESNDMNNYNRNVSISINGLNEI